MRTLVIRAPGAAIGTAGRNLDAVEHLLIAPALARCGCHVARPPARAPVEHASARLADLAAAELVLCDLTQADAQVFYELGLRHAQHHGPTVLLRGEGTASAGPGGTHLVRYPLEDPAAALPALVAAIEAAARRPAIAAEAALQSALDRLAEWRGTWRQPGTTVQERRRRAASARLLPLQAAFVHAQRLDLHALPAVLAALHATRVLATLGRTDADTGLQLHGSPAEARAALAALDREAERLRLLVLMALERITALGQRCDAALAALARAELRWLDAVDASQPDLAAVRVHDSLRAATPPPDHGPAWALAQALRERLDDAAELGLDAVSGAVCAGLGRWGVRP